MRRLSEITDEELKDVCLLSGEVLHEFEIEKIERDKDLDENVRFISVDCKCIYPDGSFSRRQICINVEGIVWTVDLKRTPCDNVCRRDVIAGQIEVFLYLIEKGFDFSKPKESVVQFMNEREKWLNRFRFSTEK